MAYDLSAYKDADLHNFYITGNGVVDVINFRQEVLDAEAKFKAAGLASPLEMLEQLDARIAAFELTIVDPAPDVIDPKKPYDRDSLIREFLEEVYSIYLYVNHGVVGSGTTADPYRENKKVERSDDDGGDINPTFPWQGVFADNETGFNGNRTDNEDQRIMKFYFELINQVFAEGEKLKTPQVDPGTGEAVSTWVVSSIPPYTHLGVTYDRVTSLKVGEDADKNPIYQTYLVPTGLDLSYVHKKKVTNQVGREVDFEFVFSSGVVYNGDDTSGQGTVLLLNVELTKYTESDGAVTLDIHVTGSTIVNHFRAMSATEYLYFWNEARIKILKGTLAYKQALVQEAQEDLRQANAALAELENVANIRNLDKDGNYTGDLSYESFQMHLFKARASTKGDSIFDTNGNDPIHNWGEWQTNRANLKAYVDRKSAQSQDLMLDYQQVLNRYNSSLEIMSKLQEKLDTLVKGQLRNM
jgi:hypothetical protein